MATASVNDERLAQNEADSTTGWTIPDGGLNTTTYAESTGSITSAVDTTSDSIYNTGTSRSLATYPLVYIWSSNIADQGTWKPATDDETPHGMKLGDGTNTIVLMNSGSDREVFKHQETQTTFQCMLIDEAYLATKDTDGEIYEEAGTYASFVETSVEVFGAYYTTLAKAFKGWNCGCDVIRIGGYGDYVNFYAGTSGDPIDFESCSVEDRSTAADRALGIIRTYTADTFGCQGRLSIGHTSATHFEHSGFVLVFEDRDVSDAAYGLRFNHATSASPYTTIILENGTIGSAGPGVEIEHAGTERLELTIDGMTFNNLKNAITFPQNLYGGAGSITGSAFNGCGQIHPGVSTFTGNSITNTTTTTTGAVLLDDVVDTDTWSDNSWIYGGGATEAAIEITQTGTYTFTDLTFTGYGITTSNTAAIYNNSGGAVTILNDGSVGITYRDGTSATTDVQSTVTTSVTVATTTGTLIENARVFLQATNATGPLPYEETVTQITRSGATASVSHTAHGMVTGKQVAIRGAAQEEYNGVYVISNVTTNGYDYTVSGTPATPATGTIKATGVMIHGLTSALGVITDTRSLSGNQPVTGHSRKSSGSPFYKSSSLVGTVDSSDGASFTAVMILDE